MDYTLIQSIEKKRLLFNTIALSVLQTTNYILPFIVLPYLVQILGIEYFGLLSFATIIIAYLNVIVDYGFNLTGTKKVSIYRENKEKIIEIFSSIMIIKFILTILSFFLLLFLIFFIEKLSANYAIYIFTFGNIIGQFLFPTWFFQGMEQMKYITYINLFSKSILVIAIFIFIKEQDDFWIVPIITSIISIISGFLSLVLLKRKFQIDFKLQEKSILIYYVKDGWYIFTSSFMSNFYRNFNILVLGIITNNTYVGYYTIADKIVKAIQTLQNIPGNVLFPFISKKISEDKKYFFKFNDKYKIFIISTFSVSNLLVYVISDYIIYIIYGEYQQQSINNLKIMSFLVLVGGLNYYYGILGLVVMNYKKYFSKYIFIVGIINIFSSYILVTYLNDFGASLSIVFSESILLLLIVIKVHKIKSIYRS